MLNKIVILSLVVATSACEIAQPFQGPKWDANKGLTDPSLTGPFVAATTEVVVKSENGAHDLFNEDVHAIEEELKTVPGFIGYSLSSVVGGDDYRTITVWVDEEAMVNFVTGKAHGKAVEDAEKIGDHGAVASWSIEKKDLPPTFDDAKRELAKSGHTVLGD